MHFVKREDSDLWILDAKGSLGTINESKDANFHFPHVRIEEMKLCVDVDNPCNTQFWDIVIEDNEDN